MNPITKRRALFAGATVCAVAIAGVAFAYFTSNGSGTATATVGNSAAVTLKATVAGTMFPGGNQTVTFTVDNPSSAAQRVGTITLASITPDAGHATCSTTITGGTPDFTMPAVAVNKVFPAKSTNGTVTNTGTLTMNDTGVSQDACQGATLTLNLTSN